MQGIYALHPPLSLYAKHMPHKKCIDVLRPSIKANHLLLPTKETLQMEWTTKIKFVLYPKLDATIVYNGQYAMYVQSTYDIHHLSPQLILIFYNQIVNYSTIPLPQILDQGPQP